MKRNSSIVIAACVLAFSGAAIAQTTDPPVRVNTTGLSAAVAAKVKEHAAQGETALRRYLAGSGRFHRIDVDQLFSEPANGATAEKVAMECAPTRIAGNGK